MEPWVHLEELDRAWNAVMSRRLGRAGTVEAEPEGLDHLEAQVSGNEPRAGNAVRATLNAGSVKSRPLQRVPLPVNAFTCPKAPLMCGKKRGRVGGRATLRVAWAGEAGKARGSNCFWVQERR